MQRVFARLSLALLAVGGVAACGSSQSQAHGTATYAAPQSQGGQAVAPQPSSSAMQVTVSLTGAGTFQAVQNTACNLTNGDLSESTTTSGQVSSGGSYDGSFDVQQAGTAQWTNTLCGTVQNVKLTSVTSLSVDATLPTTSANCQGYCSSTASVQCQGSSDPNCAASTAASCQTQCSAASKISARGQLQASDLATTNSELASSGQVDAKVDLVFNALE